MTKRILKNLSILVVILIEITLLVGCSSDNTKVSTNSSNKKNSKVESTQILDDKTGMYIDENCLPCSAK